jgi:hypothetical protein
MYYCKAELPNSLAIVNTQGLLTEYGKDLMKETQKQGGHVTILSDYDV